MKKTLKVLMYLSFYLIALVEIVQMIGEVAFRIKRMIELSMATDIFFSIDFIGETVIIPLSFILVIMMNMLAVKRELRLKPYLISGGVLIAFSIFDNFRLLNSGFWFTWLKLVFFVLLIFVPAFFSKLKSFVYFGLAALYAYLSIELFISLISYLSSIKSNPSQMIAVANNGNLLSDSLLVIFFLSLGLLTFKHTEGNGSAGQA